MGVEYLLIKDNTNEYYELGRGFWIEVFDYSKFTVNKQYKNIEKFTKIILKYFCNDKDDEEELQYCKDIAKEIYDWCGNDLVRFSSDCNDEDNRRINNEELKETGTRYRYE